MTFTPASCFLLRHVRHYTQYPLDRGGAARIAFGQHKARSVGSFHENPVHAAAKAAHVLVGALTPFGLGLLDPLRVSSPVHLGMG